MMKCVVTPLHAFQGVNAVQSSSCSYCCSNMLLDVQQHPSVPYTAIKRSDLVWNILDLLLMIYDVCSVPGGYRKLLVRPRGRDGEQHHPQGASGRKFDPLTWVVCFNVGSAGYIEALQVLSHVMGIV